MSGMNPEDLANGRMPQGMMQPSQKKGKGKGRGQFRF